MKKFILTTSLGSLILFIVTQTVSCKDNNGKNSSLDATDEQTAIAEIKQMEAQRLAAGVTKNLAVFDSATADDYIQIDFDGQVLNKPAMLERIKSSYAQLRSNQPDDMSVRVYGNTAILTARANPKGIMKGQEFTDSIRYSRIYVKRNGHWQVVLFQQTRINPKK